jgi:Na+/H+-dicarboxylate symporter
LFGLVAGFSLGALLHRASPVWTGGLLSVLDPIGVIWMSALRMTVIPLILTQLLAAVLRVGESTALGRLGAGAVGIFVLLLGFAGLFTLAVTPPLLRTLSPRLESPDVLGPGPASLAREATAAAGTPTAVADWLVNLVPTNPFKAASDGEVLPLVIFTVAIGLALSRIERARVQPVVDAVHVLADAVLLLVGWILRFMPFAVFILALSMTARIGVNSAGVVLSFVVIVSLVLVLFTLVLYPVAALGGKIPVRDFARAVLPAQLVAVSTRSSLASLPALMDGAEKRLSLPSALAGFTLPLATSTFKVNRTISSPVKLLFLAHIFGIELTVLQMATFMIAVLILSFSTLGIPNGGSSFKSLPLYLAAGIPIEGVILLEAVETIPDIFKTLVNVTGDMSAVVLVSRLPAARRLFVTAPPDIRPELSLERPHLKPSAT